VGENNLEEDHVKEETAVHMDKRGGLWKVEHHGNMSVLVGNAIKSEVSRSKCWRKKDRTRKV